MQLALLSALGCALCNGLAAVLQKIGADKVSALHGIKLNMFAGLFHKSHYIGGIILDIAAGFLTLIAVHRLPLFLAQSIIASSVIVTALIERLWLSIRLPLQTYAAMFMLLVGLSLLSLISHSAIAPLISRDVHNLLLLSSPLILLAGMACRQLKTKNSAVLLAACSGIAFGMVSVVGRVLLYPHPFWLIVTKPLAVSLIINAIIGMLFFTVALQRSTATSVNSIMVAFETVFPILIGILFLRDNVQHGRHLLLFACGMCLVVIGFMIVIINLDHTNELTSPQNSPQDS